MKTLMSVKKTMAGWFGWLRSVNALLLLLFAAGLVFYAKRDIWHPAEPLLEGIGIALITASILAFTVDAALKTRLVQDAFEASFGYILPDELKPELRSIYDIRVVCIRHEQHYELSKVGQAMIVRVRLYRTFRNVTDEVQELPQRLAVDEWFSNHGKTRIINLGYSKDNKPVHLIEQEKPNPDAALEIKYEDTILVADAGRLTLGAGEEMMSWSEFEEVKRLNDVHYMFFSHPTVRPRVTITIRDDSDETGARVNFAHRQAGRLAYPGPNSYELPGMLLVHQPIEVRWWNKADVARWKSTLDNNQTPA